MESHLPPEEYRRIWSSKPGLRAVYGEYYRLILNSCRAGVTIEIGAGAGTLQGIFSNVIATDIAPSPWIDAVADAQALPIATTSVANIVGVDVLHHIEFPRRFLVEARRVLTPGGRIVLVEPAITPLSWFAFKLGHAEPVDLRADPLVDGIPDSQRHPFDSNQAIPTLLAGRHRDRLAEEIPGLRLARNQHLSLLAYPLSGGFRRWSLLPSRIASPLLRAEHRLEPVLGRLMGFRLLLVFEMAS